MTSKLQRIVLATAIIATLPVTNAAERVDADRIAACAGERDGARRLACYDEAISASRTSPANTKPAPAATAKPAPAERAAPSPSVTPAPTAAPAASSASDFGVAGSAVARQRSAEEEEQHRGANGKIESITAEVTAVSSKPHGELVMTLDNGQVWAQKKVERRFMAKPGDKVTINAGMLGSYRMVNGKRSTQVTRLK